MQVFPNEVIRNIILNLPINTLLYFHFYYPNIISENDIKVFIKNYKLNNKLKSYYYYYQKKRINREPDNDQVFLILKFLYKYKKLIDILNKNSIKKYLDISSYSVKHRIEEYYKKYISNDSVIKAFDIYQIEVNKNSNFNSINICYKLESGFNVIINFLNIYKAEFYKTKPDKFIKLKMEEYLYKNFSNIKYNKLRKILLH